MGPQPFEGRGYVKLGIREAVLEGELASWPDSEVAMLPALASHLGESGEVFPSVIRLAILAGVSKSTAIQALKGLERRGFIQIKPRGRGRSYWMRSTEDSEAIFIRKGVVWNGLWASCTPSAMRLYLLFLSNSRPGDGGVGSNLNAEEWEEAIQESMDLEGVRHVLLRDSEPSRIRNLCGLADRTCRSAITLLRDLDLVRPSPDCDVWEIPNDPEIWMPEVIQALQAARQAEARPSAGARQSLRSRRKRRAHPAQRVPSGGIPSSREGISPEEGIIPPSSTDGLPTEDCA